MGFVSDEQKSLIEMMYQRDENLSTYLKLLEQIGKLAQKVVPAEQRTESARARIEGLVSRLSNEKIPPEEKRKTLEEVAETSIYTKIPQDVYRQIFDSGLLSMPFPEDVGGLGMPYPLFIACLELLGKASPSVAVKFAITNTVTEGLHAAYRAGKLSGDCENIMRRLIEGQMLAAFALTEVAVSGSNILKEMEARAILSEDRKHGYITGAKMFITNIDNFKVCQVLAKTYDKKRCESVISSFVVEEGAEGLSIGQILQKWGVQNSPFGELVFNNARGYIVGEEGKGKEYVMRQLNSGRITVAALALGLAQLAYDEFMDVAVNGKKNDRRHLIEYDDEKSKTAEMVSEINAARLLTYKAALLKEQYDKNPDNEELRNQYVLSANQAKLLASQICQKACEYNIQIRGGSAVVRETMAIKHWLDSWLMYFGEGVPQVLENTIAQMEARKYRPHKI